MISVKTPQKPGEKPPPALNTFFKQFGSEDAKRDLENKARGIDCLGYENTKELTIEGNTGNQTGLNMKNGSISVNGNSDDYTGQSMKSGSIIVTGNSGNSTGWGMQGGTLTVKGNTGDSTGRYMHGGKLTIGGNTGKYLGRTSKGEGARSTGGVIHLNGEFESISTVSPGADIFQRGELIVDKGRKLK